MSDFAFSLKSLNSLKTLMPKAHIIPLSYVVPCCLLENKDDSFVKDNY